MNNEDINLLIIASNKIKEIHKLNQKHITSSREEFSCNDLYIKYGIGVIEDLVNITNKISGNIVLLSPYLTKELPMLNRYKEYIFNKDSSINAYKLYDFLTKEIYDLEIGINDLLTK